MKLPTSHAASPHIRACREAILSALESGPKFRLELMRELGVTSKTTMNLCLANLRDRGKIVIVGSGFSTGRRDMDARAKLYGLPPAIESKPDPGEFAVAGRRQPIERGLLKFDMFAHQRLCELTRK